MRAIHAQLPHLCKTNLGKVKKEEKKIEEKIILRRRITRACVDRGDTLPYA